MQNIFSQGCQYALRALQVMAETPKKALTVVDVCMTAGIPEHFTRKMLQPLVRRGILRSTRGPGGGFSFARNPSEVSLLEVVVSIDTKFGDSQCALGKPDCRTSYCSLDEDWQQIELDCQKMLRRKMISDLAQGSKVLADNTSSPIS